MCTVALAVAVAADCGVDGAIIIFVALGDIIRGASRGKCVRRPPWLFMTGIIDVGEVPGVSVVGDPTWEPAAEENFY